MRIKLFNVREDEETFAYEWGKINNHEIVCTNEPLTVENVATLKSFDAVSTQQLHKFDDKIYSLLKENNIKQIAGRAAGHDMFNVKEANLNGIKITNIPAYSPHAIAEFALCRALELVRNINKITKRVSNQDFTWDSNVIAKEIRSMTVLVVGVGRIGKVSAQLFASMGAKVIGYDPYDQSLEEIEYIDDFKESIAKADIITLHVPANDGTKYMINEETIKEMKNGAYIVNTSRGITIDTNALIKGLDGGKIHSAALDVYENEFGYFSNDYSNEVIKDETLKLLIQREDVLLSPHIAFYTNIAVQNMVEIALESAVAIVSEGKSINEVNI